MSENCAGLKTISMPSHAISWPPHVFLFLVWRMQAAGSSNLQRQAKVYPEIYNVQLTPIGCLAEAQSRIPASGQFFATLYKEWQCAKVLDALNSNTTCISVVGFYNGDRQPAQYLDFTYLKREQSNANSIQSDCYTRSIHANNQYEHLSVEFTAS